MAFTSDRRFLLCSDGIEFVNVLSTKDYKKIARLRGRQFATSENGKYVVTVDKGVCHVYFTSQWRLLYSYISVGNSDQLTVDPFKRYDGTANARSLLYYSCGNEALDLAQFKDLLWVPNLTERIMRGDSINAKRLEDLKICGLTPETEQKDRDASAYIFSINPRSGGLGETVLYVNGIEARRYKPEQLKKVERGYELIVPKTELASFFVSGTENIVSIKSYTADNNISSRGLKVRETQNALKATIPNLYAVMVGVSDYKGEELDLKYAAKDATDISNAVSDAAKKLLNTDGVDHVFMYNLTTSNERYKLPEKLAIKRIFEEVGKKATANDILMIFFAGHGVMDPVKNKFYFLTAEASTLSSTATLGEVGISTLELTEWIKPQNMKAQKRIMIFDACNSGQAIKDFVKVGNDNQGYVAARNDDKSREVKAIDKLNEQSGLFILSASASNQSAYELGRYSQGLLTYSLLKAIKQQPDILEDGKYLNVSRWFNAAERTVTELAKENGARQQPQVISNTNFNIGIIDGDVVAKINLPEERALFTSSIFLNNDESISDDDLDLSRTTNLQLSSLSARGTANSIIYVSSSNSPDAWSLSGKYTVQGNVVTVKVNVRQNRVIKHRFELMGTSDKIDQLATLIVERATGLLK
jgi:uncharacterized caspase-like protein